MLRVTRGGLMPSRNQFQKALSVTHFAVESLCLFGSLLEERRQVSTFSRKIILVLTTALPKMAPRSLKSRNPKSQEVVRVLNETEGA
jgi:hypothetical protein